MDLMRIDAEFFMPFLVFAIPIIAITGGITMGIIRTLGRQRMLELHQRERIAAIERGVDPAKIPPPILPEDEGWAWDRGSSRGPRHRAQGLLIGGIITLFSGVGIMVFLRTLNTGENVWAVGVIPAMVGAGLLLSSWLVWPRGLRENSTSGDPNRS
jgi:hypothetical protein